VNSKNRSLLLVAILLTLLRSEISLADECLTLADKLADKATNVGVCEAKNLGINTYSLSEPLRAGTYCLKIPKMPENEKLVVFAHRSIQSAENKSIVQTYADSKDQCQLAVLEVPSCTTTLSFTRAKPAGDCMFTKKQISMTALNDTAACACNYHIPARSGVKARHLSIEAKLKRSFAKEISLYPEVSWLSGSFNVDLQAPLNTLESLSREESIERKQQSVESLKQLARWLNAHPEILKLGIAGVSYNSINQKIKTNNVRFKAVIDYLKKEGIDGRRLTQVTPGYLPVRPEVESGGWITISVISLDGTR